MSKASKTHKQTDMKAQALSKLDTFMVNGKPIGDYTGAELRAANRTLMLQLRTIELRMANLPDDPLIKMRTSPTRKPR